MKNKLLNYTTSIPVERTIAEIQSELVKARATSVLMEYKEGEIDAIMFKIRIKSGQELPFKLPAKVNEAYRVMYGDKTDSMVRTYGEGWRKQAKQTAWRILLTWVKAQLALIELELAKPEEVFLPYLLVGNNQTLFEREEKQQFALPSTSGVV